MTELSGRAMQSNGVADMEKLLRHLCTFEASNELKKTRQQ